MCSALGDHVFNYGQRDSADQMRTTWEKVVHHTGTVFGNDISMELLTRTETVIPAPEYTPAVLAQKLEDAQLRASQHARVQEARKLTLADLKANQGKAMDIANMSNEIALAEHAIKKPLPIKLEGEEMAR